MTWTDAILPVLAVVGFLAVAGAVAPVAGEVLFRKGEGRGDWKERAARGWKKGLSKKIVDSESGKVTYADGWGRGIYKGPKWLRREATGARDGGRRRRRRRTKRGRRSSRRRR